MAGSLKIVFLMVLAFGFLFPSEVEGIHCYSCDHPLLLNEKCTTSLDCSELRSFGCAKVKGKDNKAYSCGLNQAVGKDTCNRIGSGEFCVCFTDNCNSGRHLHGLTFIQLIAISFVVVIVGVIAKA